MRICSAFSRLLSLDIILPLEELQIERFEFRIGKYLPWMEQILENFRRPIPDQILGQYPA